MAAPLTRVRGWIRCSPVRVRVRVRVRHGAGVRVRSRSNRDGVRSKE